MSKSNKYFLAGAITLVVTALVAWLMVEFDAEENLYYSSCGIVYFARCFFLSSGLLALSCFCLAAWHCILSNSVIKAVLVFFPFILSSSLLTYAALLFFCLV